MSVHPAGILALLLSPILAFAAEPIASSLTVRGKQHELEFATAYRIQSEGHDAIAVIVSSKQIRLTRATMFPQASPRWINLDAIGRVPQVQVIFDATTGEMMSCQSWADNFGTTAFLQDVKARSGAPFSGEAKFKDGKVVGWAKYQSLSKDANRAVSFDIIFDAAINDIVLQKSK